MASYRLPANHSWNVSFSSSTRKRTRASTPRPASYEAGMVIHDGHSPKAQRAAPSSRSRTGSPARPPARPLLSVSYRHTYILRSFFPTRPIPSPSHPSIPSASTLPCRSTHSCDAAVRAQHGDGSIEEAATSSRSDISCTCVGVLLFGPTRFHHRRAYSRLQVRHAPATIYLHAQLRLPLLYFRASRVYSRVRLFVDRNSSRSSVRARRLGR
jgi:hypothetical protein